MIKGRKLILRTKEKDIRVFVINEIQCLMCSITKIWTGTDLNEQKKHENYNSNSFLNQSNPCVTKINTTFLNGSTLFL